MDKICIRNLEVFAYHGVFETEKQNGQTFKLSADLYLDTWEAAKDDDLTKSVHYGEVCQLMHNCMRETGYDLIETAAHHVLETVMVEYPLIKKMNLRLYKPQAPIELPFETVYVELERAWHQVYLGIGSNIGDKENYIKKAIETLDSYKDIRVKKVSRMIVTKPYGYLDQEDFVNGCLLIETLKEPEELLRTLNDIEKQLGLDRSKKQHWGPRCIDLDILLFDSLIVDEEYLTIPHKDMKNRDFVLEPLAQIGGFVRHPVFNRTVEELLSELKGEKNND